MSSNATGQAPPTTDETTPAASPTQATSTPEQPSSISTPASATPSPPETSAPPPLPRSTSSLLPSTLPSAPSTPSTPKSENTPTNSPSPTPSSPSPSPPPSPSPSPSPPPSATETEPEPTASTAGPPTSEDSTPSDTPTTETSAIVTVTPTDAATSVVVIVTSTTQPSGKTPDSTLSSTTSTATPIDPSAGKKESGGLDQKSKVAIGVVVPIAAIAILAIVALYFWKKRRARQEAQEERRKEVEDYAYNPNADPTIPAVGLAAEHSYEMREEGSLGYRGWGTTVAGSTGRKASTTMSGGAPNVYSDIASPSRGNMSETRSGDALLDGPHSPEGEILGAMGPSAANNRGDVRRGPSNASSSYSAAGRSDGSDNGMGVSYGSGAYYDQYGQNLYGDNGYGGPNGDVPPPPIIRDNPARRNTRIENSSHFPQQSAGISQNF